MKIFVRVLLDAARLGGSSEPKILRGVSVRASLVHEAAGPSATFLLELASALSGQVPLLFGWLEGYPFPSVENV